MVSCERLDVSSIYIKLRDIVSSHYQWPVVPNGWQLEFIAYPNGDLDMDFLNPVTGVFWSEDHEPLLMPHIEDGTPITTQTLFSASIPFMS
ncbi:MAG: hypothetical protein V7749_00735 [Cocleimonas sp.]